MFNIFQQNLLNLLNQCKFLDILIQKNIITPFLNCIKEYAFMHLCYKKEYFNIIRKSSQIY
jgi:hypothetical protein